MRFIVLLLCLIQFQVFNGAATVSLLTNYGTSAKTLASGGVEGIAAEAYSLYENPARMSSMSESGSSWFYRSLIDDESQYASLAHVFLFNDFHIGLGFTILSIPNIDYTDMNTNTNRVYSLYQFSLREKLYRVSASKSISKHLALGLGLHYYSQYMPMYDGEGLNVDLGLTYDVNRWKQSLTLKNVLSEDISYTNDIDALSFGKQLVYAAQYDWLEQWGVSGQLAYDDYTSQFLKSVAVKYDTKHYNEFYLGYKESVVAGLVKHRFSLGVGIYLNDISLYYSYEFTEYATNTRLFSLSVSF